MNKGVIYICFDSKQHEEELIYSAKSLKRYNPDISITVFTDNTQKFDEEVIFDKVIKKERKKDIFITKNFYLQETPYKYTVFLHSDTVIHGSINKVFEKLHYYDLLIAKSPQNNYSSPEFNVGVIAFKNNTKSIQFLKNWNKQIDIINKNNKYSDQKVLNILLNNEKIDLDIYELNHKIYNVRKKVFESFNETQKRNVIITHWHGQNI